MAERRGLIIVYTGDGKGKTTAALGLAVRAAGYRLRTLMLQFIKGEWKPGELRGAERLAPEFELRQMGIGFVTYKPKRPFEEHKIAAEAAWEESKAEILSDKYDIVILDEINNALHFGLLPVQEVVAFLQEKPARLHLVLTGRGAPPELIEAADLVTEMRMVKHPYDQGVPAQKGIDF
jgi:cob(I)alamin adenosyltransferase